MFEPADKKYYGRGASPGSVSTAGDRRGRPDQPLQAPVPAAAPRDNINQGADERYYGKPGRTSNPSPAASRPNASMEPPAVATNPIRVLAPVDARAAKDTALTRLKAGATLVLIDAASPAVAAAMQAQLDLAQARNELSNDLRALIRINVVATATAVVQTNPAMPPIDVAKVPVALEPEPLPEDMGKFVKGEEEEMPASAAVDDTD